MVSCPTWSKNLWRYLVMLYIDCHWREFSLKRTCALQNHVKYHIPVFNITIIRWQSQKVHALLEHPPCLHLHNKTLHSGITLLILIIDFWMDILKMLSFWPCSEIFEDGKNSKFVFELTFAIILKNWKVNQANDGLSFVIDSWSNK